MKPVDASQVTLYSATWQPLRTGDGEHSCLYTFTTIHESAGLAQVVSSGFAGSDVETAYCVGVEAHASTCFNLLML